MTTCAHIGKLKRVSTFWCNSCMLVVALGRQLYMRDQVVYRRVPHKTMCWLPLAYLLFSCLVFLFFNQALSWCIVSCPIGTDRTLQIRTDRKQKICILLRSEWENLANPLYEMHTSTPTGDRHQNEHFAWEWAHFFIKPSKRSRRNAHSDSDPKKQNGPQFRLRLGAFYDKM